MRQPLVAAVLVVASLWTTIASQPAAPKKLLFLTHAGLYKHTSLGPAETAVTELGKQGGFDVTTVQGYKQDADKLDLAFLTPEYLAQFDGLMLMTNGNLPLTDAQKRSLIDFVRNGKALIGAHCASADALQLSGVRRDARRLLPPLRPAESRRDSEGRGPDASGDAHARRQLAARRRVLSVRHRALGCGATERRTSTCCSAIASRWVSPAIAYTCS